MSTHICVSILICCFLNVCVLAYGKIDGLSFLDVNVEELSLAPYHPDSLSFYKYKVATFSLHFKQPVDIFGDKSGQVVSGDGQFRLQCEEKQFESLSVVNEESNTPLSFQHVVGKNRGRSHRVYDLQDDMYGSSDKHVLKQSLIIETATLQRRIVLLSLKALKQCTLMQLPRSSQAVSEKRVLKLLRTGTEVTSFQLALQKGRVLGDNKAIFRVTEDNVANTPVITQKKIDSRTLQSMYSISDEIVMSSGDMNSTITSFLEADTRIREEEEEVPSDTEYVDKKLAEIEEQWLPTLQNSYKVVQRNQQTYSFVPGLTETITKEQARMIPAHMKVTVPTAIAAIVKDQLPPPVALEVGNRVTWIVTNKMITELMSVVPQVVSEITMRKLELTLPSKVTQLTSRYLSPMLVKSLTHSIVPAVTKTLEYSPLRYSWCEACRDRQKLCEYCWQNETNMHNGMYYAGYYSTYYADYYNRYFDGELEQRRKFAKLNEDKLEKIRNRYQVIVDADTTDNSAEITGN